MTGPEQPPPPDPWTLGPTPPQPQQQPQPQPPAPPGWPAQPYGQSPYGQSPYGQQPAYWPYVPQPRPRRRWIWWVVIAAVLTVGGCGAVIGTVGVRAYHDMNAAKSAANQFLSAIERRDADGAQNLLCGEASPDLVQRVMSAGIVSHHVTGVNIQSGFGSRQVSQTTATVLVDITTAGGTHTEDVEVVHELGAWLVCDVGRLGGIPG